MTTSASPTTPKPKRGAPRGNQNARKHGFTPRQKNPLYNSDKSAAIDLLPEIEIMRRHIADLSTAALDLATIPEKFEALRLLTLAVTALARLVRAQSLVFNSDATSGESVIEKWEATVTQALQDAGMEWGLHDSSYGAPRPRLQPEPIDPDTMEKSQKFFDLIREYPGDYYDRKKRK